MLNKIAYKINSSILDVFRCSSLKNSYISNVISVSNCNFNSYNLSYFIYTYLSPNKQFSRINS